MTQPTKEPPCESAHFSTLVDLLRWRAKYQGGQVAFTFISDAAAEPGTLTYLELDRRARAMAATLQRMGAGAERALLLYPPGLDYIAAFFACLYAGTVAVPVYPPPPGPSARSLPRFRAIAGDAAPLFAMTAAEVLRTATPLISQAGELSNLRCLTTESVAEGMEDEWTEPAIDGDSLAVLQYTSGSTAAPRGVMLTHNNLIHNSELICSCFRHTPKSQGVIWLPPYHDMGLIGGILQPIYAGFPCALMSPLSFLQRPLRWLQAISKYKGTTSGGPDFAYDLCLRRITPEQRAGLDLSSWDVAFNGAEPIRASTMERFSAAFESCGFSWKAFYPCYGLAEATLIVSGGRKEAPPVLRAFSEAELIRNQAREGPAGEVGSRVMVGCGQAVDGARIAITDPSTSIELAAGEIGEIWVSGPSVAQGYWNQPATTEQTFRGYLNPTREGPFLRTGDLGFLLDGELFVTGRLKDLIIIGGRNLHPHDIERTVESCHPSLRPASGAAFSVATDGKERLVVVHELERNYRGIDLDTVAAEIRRAVAESHDVRVSHIAFVKPGHIPRTSSGKIEHHTCRAAFLAGTLELLETQ